MFVALREHRRVKKEEQRHHFPFSKLKSTRYERFTIFEILFVDSSIDTHRPTPLTNVIRRRQLCSKKSGKFYCVFFLFLLKTIYLAFLFLVPFLSMVPFLFMVQFLFMVPFQVTISIYGTISRYYFYLWYHFYFMVKFLLLLPFILMKIPFLCMVHFSIEDTISMYGTRFY